MEEKVIHNRALAALWTLYPNLPLISFDTLGADVAMDTFFNVSSCHKCDRGREREKQLTCWTYRTFWPYICGSES